MENPMEPTHNKGLSYKEAGVDIEAGNSLVEKIKPYVRSTARSGSDTQIGGFGGLFDLKEAGFKDPILVAANDGVGTKLKIAIETGIHDSVGIDLVAMCVNDLIVQGAEPLFFLDYLATGRLNVTQGEEIISGIAEGCRISGCALIGGETAEMPGLYTNNDYDLAGFAVGAAERHTLLPRNDIKPGDTVLGLASSGLHSNGFSLIRRIVTNSGLDYKSPSPFDQNLSLGQSLLIPTKIYVQPVLKALKETQGLKALAHITGGGFIENIPRVLPQNLAAEINLDIIKVPPVFSWISKTGTIAAIEMLRTFNCGIGMIAVVSSDEENQIKACFEQQGETVYTLGTIVENTNKRVIFNGELKV